MAALIWIHLHPDPTSIEVGKTQCALLQCSLMNHTRVRFISLLWWFQTRIFSVASRKLLCRSWFLCLHSWPCFWPFSSCAIRALVQDRFRDPALISGHIIALKQPPKADNITDMFHYVYLWWSRRSTPHGSEIPSRVKHTIYFVS